MSNESNNTNIETKKENDKTKNLNTGKNKDKKSTNIFKHYKKTNK